MSGCIENVPELIIPNEDWFPLKKISDFYLKPSGSRICTTVTVRELSHEDRVQKCKWWLNEQLLSYWIWSGKRNASVPLSPIFTQDMRSNGDMKIAYTCLNDNRSDDDDHSMHILLIHGFTASRYTWRYLAPDLAQYNKACVWAIDLLGSGDSDCPSDAIYDPRLYVHQLYDFIHCHRLKKVHLLGHSFGGCLCILFALKFPEMVHSMMLISPLLYSIEITKWYDWIDNLSFILPYCTKYMPWLLRMSLSKYSDIAAWTDLDVDQFIKPLQRKGGLLSTTAGLNRFHDLMKALNILSGHYNRLDQKFPIQIIHGVNDSTIPCSQCFEFKRQCTQTQIQMIDDVGHLLLDEKPKSISRLINQFYSKQKRKHI